MRGLADEWIDATVKELTEKGKDIMRNPETVKGSPRPTINLF
jgi:hypothetical protein